MAPPTKSPAADSQGLIHWVHRVARHLGAVRLLALPLLRGMAILAGLVWLALTPATNPGRPAMAGAVAAFTAYGMALYALIWFRPRLAFRLHLPVLLLDLGFALVLIRLSGGAHSTLYLALLLIAGVQSYYYGMARGVAVAVAASVAYIAVIWPTAAGDDVANITIRMAVLVGTAVVAGVLADVEERERLEVARLGHEAHLREEFVRNVVNSLRDGLVVLDRDGRIVSWNRATEARYGVPAGEVVGKDVVDLFPSLRREGIGERIERLLRGDVDEFTLEAAEHQTLHKGRVVLNVKASLLREHGEPAGAVLVIEDITERVALERAARQAEKLAALGTLSAGLVHELNNPIGIISSRIELMLMELEGQNLPSQLREDLLVLERNAQRVARIAKGLLSFARKSPGDRVPLDLNRVVDETLLLARKQMSQEGIQIQATLDRSLPPLLGDANALQQVVLNLITNSREAMPDGGTIAIETGPAPGRPGWVRLVVADDGPGIPPELVSKIFDPFYTTKAEGTGLGLSVSYGIIRDHRGLVDVQSEPGKGSTFILTFPAAEGRAA